MCCPAGVQKASFVVPSCAAADITSSYSNQLAATPRINPRRRRRA